MPVPFCMLRSMRASAILRRAAAAGTTATLALVALAAGASPTAEVLASPRLYLEPAAQRAISQLFVATAILDMRKVQDHPVMRARRDFSLMTALPVVEQTAATPLPLLTRTETWQLSRSVLLTFPLAITGRNFVTAEIAGTGRLAVMPTGLAQGGVLTFTGVF